VNAPPSGCGLAARRSLAVGVFGFAFLLALFPMRCFDIWWHLANGRELVEGRGLPAENRFSFTYPEHPVVPTHWLFGLGALGVYRLAGVDGLVLAKAVAVGCAFLIVYLAALKRGAHPVVAAAVTALGVLASRPRFLERPHLFTMIGLAAFAWAVCELRRGNKRLAWLLPPAAALWANLHAGCLFGVGLLCIEACASGAAWLWAHRRASTGADAGGERRSGADVARISIAAALSAVAVMASPATWTVYPYNLWHVNLDDVVPLVELRRTLPGEYPEFYLLVVAAAAALVADRRAAALGDALAVAVFAALGAYAVRAVPDFVLVATPIVALHATRAWDRSAGRPWREAVGAALARVPFAVASLALLVLPVAGHLAGGPGGRYHIGLGNARAFFPEAAAQFVADHLPNDRVFNDLSSGGYLAWHWYPARRIFIDGRTNAYPPEFFQCLYRWRVDRELVEGVADAYAVDAALLHFYRGENPFWASFDLDRWAVVHADGAAVVLLMRTPRNRPAIERFEGRLGPRGFEALSTKLTSRGDAELARAAAAARAALELDGTGGERPFDDATRARLLQRVAHGKRLTGAFEEAIELYRRALALRPGLAQARANLGWSLLSAGRADEAVGEFERALADGSRAPETLLGYAEALSAAGRTVDAKKLFVDLLVDDAAPAAVKSRAQRGAAGQ
jgi:tetratricopeptide (TPR) repeat protein